MKETDEMTLNVLQLKALTHSVIMEVKHGTALAPNAGWLKTQIKKFFGEPQNTSNMKLLGLIGEIYKQQSNSDFDKFKALLKKFDLVLYDEITNETL